MTGPLVVRTLAGAGEVEAGAWNACAGAIGAAPPPNPFLDHAFFEAVEASGSATARTGWRPHHLACFDAAGTLVGLAPTYLKSHSRGEYVFDQGWAEAYERAGGRYYPKLQTATPFTPVSGERLLVRADTDREAVRRALIEAGKAAAVEMGLSSWHVTFCTQDEQDAFVAQGLLARADIQFHFDNPGYRDFEAFLEALASRKRKLIRRERRDALEGRGLTIRRLTGADITEAAWDAFFAFYMDTGSRKWGRPYLTRDFFSRIGEAMADRILLILVEREGRYVAGALNFIGADALYGRHWGAVEDHPFLHFEVCYYQAIEFAIERGLPRVEAGAQGEHKLARGYLPKTTYSAHHIVHPGLKRAVADYLDHERRDIAAASTAMHELGPFRRSAEMTE